MKTIKVTIKYSGLLAEAIGRYLDVVEVPEGITLHELLDKITAENPAVRNLLDRAPLVLLLVNGVGILNPRKAVLKSGDEVTLMPSLYEGG